MAKYLISCPSAAMVVPEGEWEAVGPSRGPRASRRPVVVTKSYASSGSTRSPEGGMEMAQKVRKVPRRPDANQSNRDPRCPSHSHQT